MRRDVEALGGRALCLHNFEDDRCLRQASLSMPSVFWQRISACFAGFLFRNTLTARYINLEHDAVHSIG